MIKCKGCKYLKGSYNEIESHCYELKCMATSKKGKNIYWAMDLFNGIKGKERVEDFIESSNKGIPNWCPLRKGEIKNDK